ncbi:MAG: TetR/AcrR family transcriptional regulator [Chitinophagales bacterium]
MNGFERRRKEKREAILEAAFELFSTRGVGAVTIADLAKKAGVSQVTIYNYFGSKDGLAREVFHTVLDRQTAETERLLASNLPFREKAERLLIDKMQLVTDPNLELFSKAYLEDPDTQRLIDDYYEKTVPALVGKLIEQGKEAGYINPDIATDSFLLYIDLIRRGSLLPEIYPALNVKNLRDIAEIFFYGILGTGKREQ